MPDGVAPDFTYRRAIRGRFAPLIMLAGPAGVGKSYSALRLARGIAGPNGRVCVADTDAGRSRLYADDFVFDVIQLEEPFKPMVFERAAMEAQKQGADCLIIDNFGHEHMGVLEWHEEELEKLTKGDISRRDQLTMLAWARVKPHHKHMRERIYRLNIPVILATSAEKKVALIKETEGRNKGKTIPIDLGFQPTVGGDIAYAMTIALMLLDVKNPGVPVPYKALLPALRPIISLTEPLSEATGAAIAAWSRGEEKPASPVRGDDTAETGQKLQETRTSQQDTAESEKQDDAPSPPQQRRQVDEAQIEDGAKEIRDKFLAVPDRPAYFALVDNADVRRQLEWLKKHRRPLYDREIEPSRKSAWQRTAPPKEGDLV